MALRWLTKEPVSRASGAFATGGGRGLCVHGVGWIWWRPGRRGEISRERTWTGPGESSPIRQNQHIPKRISEIKDVLESRTIQKPTSVHCRRHCCCVAICSPSWHRTQALNKFMPICHCAICHHYMSMLYVIVLPWEQTEHGVLLVGRGVQWIKWWKQKDTSSWHIDHVLSQVNKLRGSWLNTQLPWWLRGLNNPPATQETLVWSLGREGPLEMGMATHSRIPAWRISPTEEPGGLLFMGSHSRTRLGD